MSHEIQVRLKLIGKEAQKFQKLKEELGLENNSEVLRFIIKRHYDNHKSELQEET